MKMKIGQPIYLNPTRYNNYKTEKIIETTVSKVGNKYFTVEYNLLKFELETMQEVSNYSPQYYAYLSMQEIYDLQEKQNINEELHNLFNYCQNDLSLSQLREIKKIINQKQN